MISRLISSVALVALTLAPGFAQADATKNAEMYRNRVIADHVADHINEAFGRSKSREISADQITVTSKYVDAKRPTTLDKYRFTFVTPIDGKRLKGRGAISIIGYTVVDEMKVMGRARAPRAMNHVR